MAACASTGAISGAAATVNRTSPLHVVLSPADRHTANTPNPAKRYLLYQQAETHISGPNGDMPLMPIYWYTYSALVHENVKGFTINPMDQTDYTDISIG